MDASCCRDTWEIRVESEAAERVLAVDWKSCSSLSAREDTPFRRPGRKARHLLFKRVGDACSFLDPESGGCRLHAKYGFEIKPHVCQRFPFRFVEAPDGVYVGFSFGCVSVLNEIGPPVAESREEAVWIYDHEPEHQQVRLPVRLDEKTPLTWEDYLALEGALDEILSRRDRPFAERLVAGHAWLGMLRRMLQVAAVETTPQPVSEVISFFVEKTRADGFERAFELAGKPVAHPVLKRMILGTFLSFRNSLRPRQWRLTTIGRIFVENIRHWARWGSLRMEPLDKRVPYRLFHPSNEALAAAETQVLLERYFRHGIFRKDLILHTDLFWGYCYFLLTYGMIQYYATGLEAIGEGNPALAVSLVEKYFVHHSNFNQTFLYHPAVGDTFQYLFKRPNFAHTIAMG